MALTSLQVVVVRPLYRNGGSIFSPASSLLAAPSRSQLCLSADVLSQNFCIFLCLCLSVVCCMRTCFFTSEVDLKDLSQSGTVHLKGFSPVWINLCLAKCFFSFRNSLWTRFMCRSRLELWEKVLPHLEHRYGFSLVWTLSW
uniref:Uncharacterized protein n=1 Tax=Echeneis naucrates TaxID=173247 RepID=A0A665X342_ECHNA